MARIAGESAPGGDPGGAGAAGPEPLSRRAAPVHSAVGVRLPLQHRARVAAYPRLVGAEAGGIGPALSYAPSSVRCSSISRTDSSNISLVNGFRSVWRARSRITW